MMQPKIQTILHTAVNNALNEHKSLHIERHEGLAVFVSQQFDRVKSVETIDENTGVHNLYELDAFGIFVVKMKHQEEEIKWHFG